MENSISTVLFTNPQGNSYKLVIKQGDTFKDVFFTNLKEAIQYQENL